MSTAEQQPGDGKIVRFCTPEEALKNARPLPPEELLVLDDISDAEWEAFYEALAET